MGPEDGERPFITFKYHISVQEEGYPGAVSNTPTYILMSETTMELNMEASAENKNTPINLDQNTYWNLIMRDPYGKGISFRFHHKKWIGESTGEVGIGYDHNYVLDCPDHVKDDASEQVVLHGCDLGN
ncbi:LOW QUALITY PROTEIN: hypothetical protein HID58_042119 [Brassica napus]|uniref:S-protein homolog n=1 Tax=Brassica napus TaxID=3708 RepID=A0ABQ8BEG1_BRANA|nr:LOW QUALITY PROTEIN: hypothetical protein HID58_042119 [Brassica napus]